MKFLLLLILQISLGNRFVEQFNEADKSFDTMTKEQIERAVTDSLLNDPLELRETSVGTFQQGFIAGANWRIESVWHKPTETPEDGKMVLCITKAGPFIGGPNNTGWEESVREFGITGWAYVDDLLPEEK